MSRPFTLDQIDQQVEKLHERLTTATLSTTMLDQGSISIDALKGLIKQSRDVQETIESLAELFDQTVMKEFNNGVNRLLLASLADANATELTEIQALLQDVNSSSRRMKPRLVFEETPVEPTDDDLETSGESSDNITEQAHYQD